MAVPQFLCLAYPCNVDGGVDPVAFVQQILQQQNNQLRNAVCQTLGVLKSTSNFDLYKKAESLRKKWGSTVAEDKTNMESDLQSAELLQKKKQLTRHPSSQVINGLDNEQITNLKAFLEYYNPMFHRGIRILYLIGHAISDRGATILQQNPADDVTFKSEKWPWPLHNYSNLKKSLQQVTDDAQQGDLVVFSSGLLTPEWVIGVLQEAESKAQNQFSNTIVIVVDACYSGTWVERMKAELERMRAQLGNAPLQYTRILLQTSCGPQEAAYGQLFTPQFVNLNLHPNYEINQENQRQTPQFLDSKNPAAQHPPIPQITHPINFKFINTPIGHMGPNFAQSRKDALCTKVPYN